jgi:hypothetical protein
VKAELFPTTVFDELKLPSVDVLQKSFQAVGQAIGYWIVYWNPSSLRVPIFSIDLRYKSISSTTEDHRMVPFVVAVINSQSPV